MHRHQYTVLVQVDMTRVLSTALQQQTQLRDGIIGEDTVAKHYLDFYFDLLRRAVSHLVTPGVVYVPGLRGFVSVTLEAANVPPTAASTVGLQPTASVLAAMNAAPPASGDKDKGQTAPLQHCFVDHYMSWPGALLLFTLLPLIAPLDHLYFATLTELVALAEILGVYGVRSLSEKLIGATGNQIEELKVLGLAIQYESTINIHIFLLIIYSIHFDDPSINPSKIPINTLLYQQIEICH